MRVSMPVACRITAIGHRLLFANAVEHGVGLNPSQDTLHRITVPDFAAGS